MGVRFGIARLVLAVGLVGFCAASSGAIRGQALYDGREDSGVTTFGYGALKVGSPFFMLGPGLENKSDLPITVVSVSSQPLEPGAIFLGWSLEKVTPRGAFTAYSPDSDTVSREFASQLQDVTATDSRLARQSANPDDVFLYLEFVLQTRGAYKTGDVEVAYLQGGRVYKQSLPVRYRFQTPDFSPLP